MYLLDFRIYDMLDAAVRCLIIIVVVPLFLV